MRTMRVANIRYQSNHMVMYRVPSKSRPRETHITEFGPGDKRTCTCPGIEWFITKGIEHMKICRHQRMTTIELTEPPEQGELLFHDARMLIKDKYISLEAVWGHIRCMEPEHYDEYAIHCTGCQLYPRVCNIHKIRYGARKNRIPLIWKLQTAIYNGNRKEARGILNQVRSALKRMKVPSVSVETTAASNGVWRP